MKLKRLIYGIVALLMAGAAVQQALAYTEYEVKSKDTIFGIAKRFKVDVDTLIKYNPATKNGVKKGMVVIIPDAGESLPTAISQDVAAPAPAIEVAAPDQNVAENEPEAPTAPIVSENYSDEPVAQPKAQAAIPEPKDYYFSRPGDTFKSIAANFNLTEDQIIELNPFLNPNMLPVGSYVRLNDNAPYNLRNDETPQHSVVTEADSTFTPPTIGDLFGSPDELFADSALIDGRTNLLIMLPFMSTSDEPSKRAQQYADFYRGFLLGAQQLSDMPGAEVEVLAYDTNNSPDQVAKLIRNTADRNIAVIIAPEDEKQLQAAIDAATPQGVYVLNVFNVKADDYANNAYVLQANINPELMYAKAIEALLTEFEGYTPVILDAKDGKAEKEPFVQALRSKYAELGLEVLDVTFDDVLSAKDLSALAADGKYVFIPKSGSLNVFNRFASSIYALRRNDDNPDRLRVFGYPDWTAFRNDSRETLHFLNATVYSRFFLDEESQDTRRVQDDFTHWYGRTMLEAIPNQGILGYDVATYILKGLQNYPGRIGQFFNSNDYTQGIQSTFDFSHRDNAGYINQALYIIEFMPGNQVNVKVL